MEENLNNDGTGPIPQPSTLPPVPEADNTVISPQVSESTYSPQPSPVIPPEQSVASPNGSDKFVYAPQPEQSAQSLDVPPPMSVPVEGDMSSWSQPTPAGFAATAEAGGGNRFIAFMNKHKKLLIFIGITLLVIPMLGAAGYFGYRAFVRSSDIRILNATAKNTILATNMSIDFRTGVSGISIKGNIDVDEDQNMFIKLENDLFPLEGMYIKSADTGYLKELASLFMSGSASSGDKKVTEEKYTQYTNVQKAIEKYGLSEMGFDSLNPNKNYLTKENLKYIKKVGNEKVNNVSLYKYSFVPDDELKKETTDKINKSLKRYDEESAITIKNADTTLDLWIGASDLKVRKVSGETKYTYTYSIPDYESCYKMDDNSKYEDCYTNAPKKKMNESVSFEWELDITYDYKGTISLPANAKVSETIDLSMLQEKRAEAEKRNILVEDNTTKKRLSSDVVNSLGMYYSEKGTFPDNLEQLVPAYIDSIPKLPGETKFIYTKGSDEKTFILKVKIEPVPDYEEDKVEGGYYVLRETDIYTY